VGTFTALYFVVFFGFGMLGLFGPVVHAIGIVLGSLANGIPMANILFPPASVGILVLPLMLFHQIQLMLCAVLAQRYAKRPQED